MVVTVLIVAALLGRGTTALGSERPAGDRDSVVTATAAMSAQAQPEGQNADEPHPQHPTSAAEHWIMAISLGATPLALIALWLLDVIRPGSLRRVGVREVTVYPWPVWICAAVLVFLAANLGGSVAALVAGIERQDAESLRAQGILSIGSNALAVGVAALLCYWLGRSPASGTASPGWLRFRAGDIPRGFLAIVLAYPVVAASSYGAVRLYVMLTDKVPEHIAHRSLEAIVDGSSNPWSWVIAVAAVIAAPIVEETIYRVFLTAMLLRLGAPAWLAIFACSTLFALSHANLVPWYAMVPLGVLGLAMGVAYERTKRLGVPIIMHACFNAMNVAVAVWSS